MWYVDPQLVGTSLVPRPFLSLKYFVEGKGLGTRLVGTGYIVLLNDSVDLQICHDHFTVTGAVLFSQGHQ